MPEPDKKDKVIYYLSFGRISSTPNIPKIDNFIIEFYDILGFLDAVKSFGDDFLEMLEEDMEKSNE